MFGHLQLREINRQLIRTWVAEVAPHYKPATVRSWKVNLTTILNVAVSLDYIPANPALGVKTRSRHVVTSWPNDAGAAAHDRRLALSYIL